MFRRALPSLVLLIVSATALAANPADAAIAALADARKLEAIDAKSGRNERIFYRYLWWPKGWTHAALLTRAQQALLSDQGSFPNPVHVGQGVYRLDSRESGWDRSKGKDKLTGLQVWEKFSGIDFVFYWKRKILEPLYVTVYFPPGAYDGVEYPDASSQQLAKAAGDIQNTPADYANVLADKGPGAAVRAMDELRRILSTEAPIVSGPFWFVRTSREIDINNTNNGVGYYQWFGIKNRNDYFDLVGLNEATAIKRFQDWREVVKRSGISQQNRQVVVLGASTGLVWGTLDTFSQKDRGIAVRNLRRNEFDADAEEYISHLPNGLPAVALVASKDNDKLGIKAGDVQESAPDKIGPDKSEFNQHPNNNDFRVHNGISCWRCHGVNVDYLRPIDGWARKTFRRNKAMLREYDRKVFLELESQYLRPLEKQIAADRKKYTDAVALLTSTSEKDPGLTVAGFTRIYCGAWNQYVNDDVTLETAADELGVHRDVLLKALIAANEKRGASDLELGEFLDDPPGVLSRLSWESSYQYAMMLSKGSRVPEIVIKAKAFDTKVKPKAKKGEGE